MRSSLSESQKTPVRYQIPTHLNVPDKIAIPLLGITVEVTIRQGLIFLLGWSVAFNIWRQLEPLSFYGMVGTVLRLIIPTLLAIATFIVATIRVSGRHLEEWMAVFLRYRRLPHMYVWRSVVENTSPLDTVVPTPEQKTPVIQQINDEEEE